MNKEIKEEWVKALRSGEYSQCKNYLKAGDYYCCLGVLCELQGFNGLVNKVLTGVEADSVGLAGNSGELPRLVKYKENYYWTLAQLNDAGMSFEEIADVIEEYF